MKSILVSLALATLLLTGCDNRKMAQQAQAAVTETSPKIEFAEKGVYNFGDITEGDTVEHVFKFTNAGDSPLVINNITASCGCTTPEWPRDPVAPGADGSVKVRFNSVGKIGQQNKTITVYANTNPPMTDLSFQVMVQPKPGADKTVAP